MQRHRQAVNMRLAMRLRGVYADCRTSGNDGSKVSVGSRPRKSTSPKASAETCGALSHSSARPASTAFRHASAARPS